MKKCLIAGASVLALSFVNLGYAVSWFNHESADSATSVAAQKTEQINLYQEANAKSHVVGKVSPQSNLVMIMRKGQWVKVGDRSNGQVGWINRKQYISAREKWMRPDIQQVYVNVEKDPKTGKMVYNVVAYKNGKKLSEEKAQQLYQKLRLQQQKEWKNSRRIQRQMQKVFDWDWQKMQQIQRQLNQDNNNDIRHFFGPGPVMPPIKQ